MGGPGRLPRDRCTFIQMMPFHYFLPVVLGQSPLTRFGPSAEFTLVMLAIAGSMALALGIVGIYGVMSYSVSQRKREIGIRLALGAQQDSLKRSFLRQGLGLASIGVAIGLGASVPLSRLMSSLLFGIQPLDLPTFAAVAVDPVEALKAG